MKRLILTSLCLLFARGAFAWGQKGHDVTAYIAECRLTPEAAEKVRKALDGYSPVYIANWLDFASYWPEYAYSKTCTTSISTKARRWRACPGIPGATC